MEAFSLLKYWRNGAAACTPRSASASATTFVTAVSDNFSQTDDEEGPFFDLEFSVPDDEQEQGVKEEENDVGFLGEEEEKVEDSDSDCSVGEDGREMKFTLSSASSGDCIDPNVSLSPSDDLFFKGRLLSIEPSSESNSKSQFPVSLVKSATKFRVLMLKLKKSKPNVPRKAESNGSAEGDKKEHSRPQTEKKLRVKFKVEEVPIVSLFTKENSSKNGKAQKQNQNTEESVSEEKRFSKDVMQRYLKKVRPFYVRTSKRYGEKMRLTGHLKVAGAANAELSSVTCTAAKIETEAVEASNVPPPGSAKSQKAGNLPTGLREVYKHLGKSRSASSTVAAAPSAAVVSKRRDDSLLQQQDGIQSAILHCKRSFKASRDSERRSNSEESG